MFKTLLVPVDGSKSAEKALQVACKLAHPDLAKLYILHVPEQVSHEAVLVWGAGAVLMDAPSEEVEDAGRKIAAGARQAATEYGITNIEVAIEQGRPARVILERAKAWEVDAVVMGSRGLSNIAGLVVGSVSHKVTHSAGCTVITVA